MSATLQAFAQLDIPVLIAIGGLGASFILSALHLGRSLALAGSRP